MSEHSPIALDSGTAVSLHLLSKLVALVLEGNENRLVALSHTKSESCPRANAVKLPFDDIIQQHSDSCMRALGAWKLPTTRVCRRRSRSVGTL